MTLPFVEAKQVFARRASANAGSFQPRLLRPDSGFGHCATAVTSERFGPARRVTQALATYCAALLRLSGLPGTTAWFEL